ELRPMKIYHIECAARAAHKSTSDDRNWSNLSENEKNQYRSLASAVITSYLCASDENSGPAEAAITDNEYREKIKAWVENHSTSYIRVRLGISQAQAEGIKSGASAYLDQFDKLLHWAILSEPVSIQAELEGIEASSGLSRAQTALML